MIIAPDRQGGGSPAKGERRRNLKEITIRIITLAVGGAIGYLLGSRAGRESYDRIVEGARNLLKDPRTRRTIDDLGRTVKEKAPDVSEAATAAAATIKDKFHLRKDTGATALAHHEPDVDSDPALSADTGRDWTDEGGATPAGPATPSAGT